MPIVNISLYSGRTTEQKSKIAKAVTKAISESAGVNDSDTIVLFHDIEKTNWANAGNIVSEE